MQRGIPRAILSITFTAYRRKKIDSLKLMEADVAYSFKYSDRSVLNTLLQEKGDCDEILIVKNSCITDTSFSNVVFSKDDLFHPRYIPIKRHQAATTPSGEKNP